MRALSTNEAWKWKRVANERLRSASQPLPADARVPFICECDDHWCLGRVEVALLVYDRVQGQGGAVRLPEHSPESSPGAVSRRALSS